MVGDGEGANVVDGVAGDFQAFAVFDDDGVLLAISVSVIKLNGKLSVAFVHSHLDETLHGRGGVNVDGVAVGDDIDGSSPHIGVVVGNSAEAAVRKV